jgi:hypothetical protein
VTVARVAQRASCTSSVLSVAKKLSTTAFVPTVPPSTHADRDPGGGERPLVVDTRVVRAAVGVVQEPGARPPLGQRPPEGCPRQTLVQRPTRRPADHGATRDPATQPRRATPRSSSRPSRHPPTRDRARAPQSAGRAYSVLPVPSPRSGSSPDTADCAWPASLPAASAGRCASAHAGAPAPATRGGSGDSHTRADSRHEWPGSPGAAPRPSGPAGSAIACARRKSPRARQRVPDTSA